MSVSQKCQYALRAVLELAGRYGNGPTSIRCIAEVQAIPQKFLELILAELRRGGFVSSRRGVHGGYSLSIAPRSLAVGEIIRFIDGPIGPISRMADDAGRNRPRAEDGAMIDMWVRARDAVTEVYDSTTFRNLLDARQAASDQYVPGYCI